MNVPDYSERSQRMERLFKGEEIPVFSYAHGTVGHMCVCDDAWTCGWKYNEFVVWHGTVSPDDVDQVLGAYGWKSRRHLDYTIASRERGSGRCQCAALQGRLQELGYDRITLGEGSPSKGLPLEFRTRGRKDEKLGLIRGFRNATAGWKNG